MLFAQMHGVWMILGFGLQNSAPPADTTCLGSKSLCVRVVEYTASDDLMVYSPNL